VRVLVLHSYHPQLDWTAGLREGIDTGFADFERPVDVFHEFLDAKRLPALEHGESFLEFLETKYVAEPPDLLMVSDDPGLMLLVKHRSSFFPGTPLVYLGINQVAPKVVELPNATGVFELHSTVDTAYGALEQTGNLGLIVINDSTETGIANLGGIRTLESRTDSPAPLIVLNDLTPESAPHALERYSAEMPVLLLGQLRRHSEGALLSFEETAKILRATIPNPIYAESVTFLGHGVVGGRVLDAEHHAEKAVELAGLVLAKGSAEGIAPITQPKTEWTFDYRELDRFGIDLASLPADSRVIHKSPTFYELYKHVVWIVLGVFAVSLSMIALLTEILRRKTVERRLLQENERRYRDLAEAGASVFWELDAEGVFTNFHNASGALRARSPETMLGRSIDDIVKSFPSLEFDLEAFQQSFLEQRPIRDFLFRVRTTDESVRILKLSGTPIFDDEGVFRGYRGIQREITKEYELAETLAYQASYDWLTGLVNRYEFNNQLEESISAHSDEPAVLCYLDLDQFKIVNDTAGHLVGDRLLVDVAKLLQNELRDSDVLGRLGGDEFGLILKPCTLESAQQVCERLIAVTRSYRFQWEGRSFAVGCSIGIVSISDRPSSVADLLSRADVACYKAKDMGRGRVFADLPREVRLDTTRTGMAHVANLQRYIDEGRFFLVGQEIRGITPSTEKELGFEVLVRFLDDDGSVVAPGAFIPAMEQYGAISLLDRWVLKTVVEQRYEWLDGSLVGINLSGISLGDERFRRDALAHFRQIGADASQICFEITETAAIAHMDDARIFIHSMRELGAKFALDDFGSGTASFGYLRDLNVDYVKIDGNLVRDIVRDPNDFEIVQFVNDIAHKRGMKTVAEFVEDEATLDRLKTIGVDYAQGFGIARPRALTRRPPIGLHSALVSV